MKSSDLYKASSTAAEILVYAAGIFAITSVVQAVKSFNENKKQGSPKISHHLNDIHAYIDSSGKPIKNTSGEGTLVASNYMGTDGEIYQYSNDKKWYKLTGSSWKVINI